MRCNMTLVMGCDWAYTPAMREFTVSALFLLCLAAAPAQTPAGWKVVKDAKSACQISVPPDWVPFTDGQGAAVLHDATTAIAVVTSQPGQSLKPITDSQLKILEVPREKIFENTAKRLFYQDRTSRGPEDPNAYSAMVPSKSGTCSCRVVFVPAIPQETARKIALSLGPVAEDKETSSQVR